MFRFVVLEKMEWHGFVWCKISLLYGLIWKMNDPKVLVDILQINIYIYTVSDRQLEYGI